VGVELAERTRADARVSRPRTEIAGVLVDRIDREAARTILDGFLVDGARHQVCTVNSDFLAIAQRDASFRETVNRADLAVADGMPLVWLSRLLRAPLPERVTGFDLIGIACELAARSGVGVFLLGAGPGIAARAGQMLQRTHPGLRIAGTYSPPFGPHDTAEERRMVQHISAAGRCLLFVAFGAPKQDRFIRAHLAELDVPIAIGIGGALDILSGTVPRAPGWMQRAGFEWVWRMAQEPGRMWRRYLVDDTRIVASVAVAALRNGVRAGTGSR
jgi:N-acetylglucosaminyldiphosphoundecaprenol N-acetyl-beta-D-mannosaminyltransferase